MWMPGQDKVGIMKSSPPADQGARQKVGLGKVFPPLAWYRGGSVDRDAPRPPQPAASPCTADKNGTDSASGHAGDWRAGRSSECARNWRARHAAGSDVEIHRPRASSFELGARGRSLAIGR